MRNKYDRLTIIISILAIIFSLLSLLMSEYAHGEENASVVDEHFVIEDTDWSTIDVWTLNYGDDVVLAFPEGVMEGTKRLYKTDELRLRRCKPTDSCDWRIVIGGRMCRAPRAAHRE